MNRSTIPLLAIAVLISTSCAGPNRTAERVAAFQSAVAGAGENAVSGTSASAKAGVERHIAFLSRIDEPAHITEHVDEIFAPDSWLNDTLQTHRGPEEIGAYFVELAEMMQDFHLEVDDISYAKQDVYIRWRMDYRIPSLRKTPIQTIGMSQLRFDREGRVLLQQDYWDSAAGVYEHIPVVGGVVGAGRD